MGRILPVIPLRGIAILPGMLIHFDIKRDASKEAVDAAVRAKEEIFLVTQLDKTVENPGVSDLYSTGTTASIRQVIKLPGDVVRVMVQGEKRGKLQSLEMTGGYLSADITVTEDEVLINEITERAMVSALKDVIDIFGNANPKFPHAVFEQLKEINNIKDLVRNSLVSLPLSLEAKLAVFEIDDFADRYEKLYTTLVQEIDLIRIKRDFQEKVKEKVDTNQREYLLREQMKVIREELGDEKYQDEADEFADKAKALDAPENVKAKILKEIDRYKNLSSNSSESQVSRGYIETLLDLPWNKVSEDNNDTINAASILDEDHYGLEKVKERILEFLAVRAKKKDVTETGIICLVGPPGTGKTSIVRSVARALNKKYVRVSLGGVRDEAEIRGHRRTYIGAMPGRIISGLKNAGVSNPLILLDEIDKVSSDYKGDTSSALLEVLDPEQNRFFEDHYIDMPVDLSRVLFIATANDINTIPRPLIDRMEIIEVTSYTANEKFHIAKEHLIPKQKEKNGLNKGELTITDAALRSIIENYTREAGVRTLERKIAQICRKADKEIVEKGTKAIKVNEKNLKDFLGKKTYRPDKAAERPEVGIVRGLAWTSVGGDTLEIEVNVMPGKGSLQLTGQLGDVMKESAMTGISYIRSVSKKYGIDDKYFFKHDVHIHVPEGAVPKDGPSAGITIATAVLSAATGKKVRSDIAMTGEITLRGRVLPIGGLKEKLLAAKSAGITTVLVPKKNESDIEELSDEIKEGMQIKLVSDMKEVIEAAFV
ncbi:MAG: endopeptidase La [Lachnospiraceae bacterium]|nr:endopeptidase La [Lachnospiraceae bacterium]